MEGKTGNGRCKRERALPRGIPSVHGALIMSDMAMLTYGDVKIEIPLNLNYWSQHLWVHPILLVPSS